MIATPHNVHIANALGVVVAGRVAGRLERRSEPSVALDVPVATRDLAWRVLESFAAAERAVGGCQLRLATTRRRRSRRWTGAS